VQWLAASQYFNGLTLSNCRVGCKPGLGANVQQAVSKNT
jgi:hypothetical protein